MINRTTQFIMPLLIDKKYSNAIRAYLAINELKDIPNNIYVILIDKKDEEYIKNNIYYHGEIKINNEIYYSLFICDEFKEDFKKFIIGAYSKISNKSKRKIVNFWKNENKTVYNIVYNTLYNIEETRNKLLDFLYSKDDRNKGKKILEEVEEVNSKITIEEEIIITNKKVLL